MKAPYLHKDKQTAIFVRLSENVLPVGRNRQ